MVLELLGSNNKPPLNSVTLCCNAFGSSCVSFGLHFTTLHACQGLFVVPMLTCDVHQLLTHHSHHNHLIRKGLFSHLIIAINQRQCQCVIFQTFFNLQFLELASPIPTTVTPLNMKSLYPLYSYPLYVNHTKMNKE